ncbi:uncharacterized protein LOC130186961 isoform X2 [Seriola aureovittata]|uniref:uncharacterized protein LOC130186961 isoform X2 n=1 Tax=Seriola aureovittata TaxID=2871759 RepID=UPI0024BE4EAD|nr:uncharacterized protein LOC130186961 isoform X2 [Seriola aureovittata]
MIGLRADLPRPGRILQLIVTNLRNRPLSSTNIESMRDFILSLYHNLITSSKDFPVIPFKGTFRSRQLATPFDEVAQERVENTTPSPPVEGPSGLMAPPAASRSVTSPILTPVLPEKTDPGRLKADRRNYVRRIEFDDKTVTRVISPVYRSESTELTNRWRVSDYSADGQVLMSVLCKFAKESTWCARTQMKKKRKDTEEGKSQLHGQSQSYNITDPPMTGRTNWKNRLIEEGGEDRNSLTEASDAVNSTCTSLPVNSTSQQ